MITRCHHGGNYSTNKEVTNLHNRKQAKPHRILLFQNNKPTTLSDLHSRAQRILKLKKIIMQNLQKSKHKKRTLKIWSRNTLTEIRATVPSLFTLQRCSLPVCRSAWVTHLIVFYENRHHSYWTT